MKITLEINEEKQLAQLEGAENGLTTKELYIAVSSFLLVVADNIKANGGTYDDVENTVLMMINMQLSDIEEQLFNKENDNAN